MSEELVEWVNHDAYERAMAAHERFALTAKERYEVQQIVREVLAEVPEPKWDYNPYTRRGGMRWGPPAHPSSDLRDAVEEDDVRDERRKKES